MIAVYVCGLIWIWLAFFWSLNCTYAPFSIYNYYLFILVSVICWDLYEAWSLKKQNKNHLFSPFPKSHTKKPQRQTHKNKPKKLIYYLQDTSEFNVATSSLHALSNSMALSRNDKQSPHSSPRMTRRSVTPNVSSSIAISQTTNDIYASQQQHQQQVQQGAKHTVE